MRFVDLVRPALRQFRTQRLQALLIAVAIALGVGVVVAVAALTEGSNEAMASLSDSLMGREITVRSSASRSMRLDDPFAAARRIGPVMDEPVMLGYEDLEAAHSALSLVPYLYFQQSELLTTGGELGRPELISASRVTADYFAASDLEVLQGGLFTAADYEAEGNSVLVTPGLLEELEVTGEPVGQSVEFSQGGTLTIVGVVEASDDPFARETLAYLPLTPSTIQENVNLTLKAAVADAQNLDAARAEVEAFARGRWGEGAVVETALGQVDAGPNTTFLLIAGFASLGLLVAALNIMNLMLARVLKRQRDIGILRSLGASRRVVGAQVLLEAVVLGLLGGLLGLAAGFGLLAAYDAYLKALASGVQVIDAPTMRWGSAALGVGVALTISLIFGAYPAAVAARVRPVTALRSL